MSDTAVPVITRPAIKPPHQPYFYLKSRETGRVFPYSAALAQRADMEPYVPPKMRAKPAPAKAAEAGKDAGKPARGKERQMDLEDALKTATEAGGSDETDTNDETD